MQIVPPFLPVRRIARKMLASSSMKTPGYAMNSLNERDALLDHRVHLDLDLIGELGDDHVEAVVDRGLAFGLLHPRFPRVMQRLAFVLDGEVDDRRGAAEGRGDGAGLEVVGRGRAAERHVHVGVHVDAAGQDVLALGVDDAIGRHRQGRADGRDLVAFDEDVADILISRRDDGAVLDENAHVAPTIPSQLQPIRIAGLAHCDR